ncbi:DNA polymerase I [Methylocella silvestris BL2]|uniref:DNA polymerase I n=1 Tax=Methylocella silvestris (strain DSM 15510 / CIP 108128 / LMG 27833 / NCIMB 13906 / BL2) TaxID=395965 RepID=B8ESM1_METSB|nr:DNA polymerase I [Methylocella silvestris]ACK50356.1 DNA polymerase I [Methylocella silvestris BL2]
MPTPASQTPVQSGDHVFLVDGSSFVFRAYFQSIRQDAKYNYRSDGLPTGAVRLFCTKIFQFVREGAAGVKPTHLAIIFDKSENSFRKEIYPPYKGNRSEPPEDLIPQFPLMRAAVRAFGLLPVEQDRYEADDLIATYARQARERGADVTIISADKDLMQLIGPGVSMYDPASGEAGAKGSREERRIGVDEVLAYFGVPPEKVVDVQALAGDSTDNVPGARGIGLKTAAQLIGEYGDLDTLLARAGEIKQPKRREILTDADSVALIRTSRKLVELVCDVEVETPLDDLRLAAPEGKTLVAFCKALEFTTLTRRVAEACAVEPALIEPDPDFAGEAGWRGRNGAPPPVSTAAETPSAENLPQGPKRNARYGAEAPQQTIATGPGELAAARAAQARAEKFDLGAYETIVSFERLEAYIAEAIESGIIAIDTETSSLDPMQAELVGLSLCLAPGRAAYVPLRHRGEGAGDLFGGADLVPGQLDSDETLARLKPMLEAPDVLKIAQNAKFDQLVLAQRGIRLAPVDDTLLLSYVLDAGRTDHGMDVLAEKYFGHRPIQFGAVAGSGRTFIGFARVALDKATEYSAEDADVTLRLWRVLKPRLAAERMSAVYETLERPMVETLARMERRGVSIDRAILSRLSGEFAQDMARLEAVIFELAGESFNLGSPKQLGDILFGKMGLAGARKTATGAWSTAAGVLDDLAEQGVPLAARILDWRQLSKLKSTYTDALPSYVNPETGRVHTSYALAATTTGRLSSSEPNLQNIPVRNEAGRKIRKAFIAPPGRKLISADYSQIELRLLAHIADISQLRAAFAENLDIHAMTASEMFGVPVEGMPPEVRRRAKAINFGIIYGISAFGLANQLAIPREEAGAYIKRYFERFPGIRAYMDATKQFARENGYVTTIFGRKCHYPRITASNPSERAFNERAAINAPIQGSAADIIRRAMVRMDEALEKAGLSAQMLLQVHDELVFEAPDEEIDATIDVVRKVMVDAPHPFLQLAVPLQVDAKAAQNWDEAH